VANELDGSDLTPTPSTADHVRGSLDAAAVITEFGDFECPFCGHAYGVLEDIRKKYGDRVALVFRHFPLRMHPHARSAAEASEAAAAAGKFWEMHDVLYEHQQALEDADLLGYAESLGISGDAVDKAIRDGQYAERIARDRQSGTDSGIPGTPALFINGFAFDDDVSVDALSEAIDLAFEAKQQP
jgi:protein-disulfide isomerase